MKLETAFDTPTLAKGASTLPRDVSRVQRAEFFPLELDGRDIHAQAERGADHAASQFVGAVAEWPDDGDVNPAEIRSHRISHNPADRTATLSDRRGVAYCSCRALGRNRLPSSGVAFD